MANELILENEYYRVIADKSSDLRASRHRVQALIYRKDTDEKVWLLSISVKSSEAEIQALKTPAVKKLQELGRPADWPRRPTAAKLLKEYLASSLKQDEGNLDPTSLPPKERALWHQRVNSLSAEDRLALVHQTPEQRQKKGRFTWLDDETLGKFWLFKLIDHPTSAEIEAHSHLEEYWFKRTGCRIDQVNS